ncbi:MAG: SRPBCC family protein [Candidatus Thermoplasmatota archaeon]|nr:SRPBCC family protein [Candidatus Thermoplasmatota archaeon]
MLKFTVNTTINKPAGIVVEALMDPTNFPYWQRDLERFEVINGKPGEVGSVGLLHYTQKGRPYVMEDRLIECEPGKRYLSRVKGDVIIAQVETILKPLGKKTSMTLTWSGKGTRFPLNLLLPLMKRKMIKQSRSELETFKNLIETKGRSFG